MKVKIAILDLYDGHPNEGMRCLRDIANRWGRENGYDIVFDIYDVRRELAVPDTSYDAYISTGGPGSPLDSVNSEWERVYFDWVEMIDDWNNDVTKTQKKNVFFICHSFQLMCRYYNVATVCKRKSTAFGVFPVHMLPQGQNEPIFNNLADPFFTVDSRDFQVIAPNYRKLGEMNATLLAIEKERPHVPYERAIMALRFNEYFVGTQFHPEADATGMSMYLQRDDKKKTVIDNYGKEKWESMITQLNDPEKISYTYSHILPNFLNHAVGILVEQD